MTWRRRSLESQMRALKRCVNKSRAFRVGTKDCSTYSVWYEQLAGLRTACATFLFWCCVGMLEQITSTPLEVVCHRLLISLYCTFTIALSALHKIRWCWCGMSTQSENQLFLSALVAMYQVANPFVLSEAIFVVRIRIKKVVLALCKKLALDLVEESKSIRFLVLKYRLEYPDISSYSTAWESLGG